MSELVLKEISDQVATLTINRPEQRNALSPDMLQDIADFIGQIENDPEVRCLVIRGAGEHFIGGGDVSSFGPTLELSPLERRLTYERRLMNSAHLFHKLERLRIPVVAVVRGAVAGAGVSFALAADLTLASDTSYFFFAHGQLGLSLDGALSYYLPRTVGLRKAKELSLLQARVSAEEALALGIANRVIPDEQLEEEASKYIARLANGPTIAMGLTKSLLESSTRNSINQQIRMEAEACGTCVASADFHEGVSAFLDKRRPTFTGS